MCFFFIKKLYTGANLLPTPETKGIGETNHCIIESSDIPIDGIEFLNKFRRRVFYFEITPEFSIRSLSQVMKMNEVKDLICHDVDPSIVLVDMCLATMSETLDVRQEALHGLNSDPDGRGFQGFDKR